MALYRTVPDVGRENTFSTILSGAVQVRIPAVSTSRASVGRSLLHEPRPTHPVRWDRFSDEYFLVFFCVPVCFNSIGTANLAVRPLGMGEEPKCFFPFCWIAEDLEFNALVFWLGECVADKNKLVRIVDLTGPSLLARRRFFLLAGFLLPFFLSCVCG